MHIFSNDSNSPNQVLPPSILPEAMRKSVSTRVGVHDVLMDTGDETFFFAKDYFLMIAASFLHNSTVVVYL